MTSHQGEWAEDRGAARDKNNPLRFPLEGDFYKSTADILPWTKVVGGADADTHADIASAFLENLFRECEVPDPSEINPDKTFIERCLHLDDFMAGALETLLNEGLCHYEGEDSTEELEIFADTTALYLKADKIIREMPDHEAFKVGDDSWEWLEGFDDRPEDSGIKWFAKLPIVTLVDKTRKLAAYTALNLILGPRSTAESRIAAGSTFHTMVGGAEGGALPRAIKSFLLPGQAADTTFAPAFLLGRITEYLTESRWPRVYEMDFSTFDEYAFDVLAKADLKTASRQQWAAKVATRLGRAIERNLPTLRP